MKNLTFAKALIGTLAAAAIASPALAQHREHERERFATPHWVFDDRFHHNHYYPALGYSVGALPPGSVSLVFRGGRFFYHAGVWFQVGGPGYVVVRPPLGVVVPVLPPSYTTVYVGGVPYYYANDVYYASAPGGYVVAQPPMDPSQAMAPAPAAPAPAPGPAASAPGNWYFCESQKNYYPYVTQCAEGWKTVP
ncbi:MAG: hypothetical protein JO035_03180, partial [Betaproteobacteria bacterium]|nr:hypothetical protein [Betaproteobacteria bacterium]